MYKFYIVSLIILNNGIKNYYYPEISIDLNVEYKCFNIDFMTCKIKVDSSVSIPNGTEINERQYEEPCGV